MSRVRILLTLFVEMFKIALFVMGGGFAILAAADDVFARKLKWTEEGEIIGRLPVFQMVPGIIAGNTAVYVGHKMAGVPGAAAALLGTVLPSVGVFTAVTVWYDAIPVGNAHLAAAFVGLRAALTGIVAAMLVRTWSRSVRGAWGYAVCAVATVAVGVCGIGAAWVIAGCALAGIVRECAGRARAHGGTRFRCCAWAIPLVFLKYGLTAFGGGYVLVPMYLTDFVGSTAKYLQLPAADFANVMALTQMTPGPIAINCATFFGYRLGGFPGALAASLVMVLPGFVLLILLLRSFERHGTNPLVTGLLAGVRPVTAALMLTAAWAFAGMSIWMRGADGTIAFHPTAAVLAALVFLGQYTHRVGVVKLIAGSAILAVAMEAALGGAT